MGVALVVIAVLFGLLVLLLAVPIDVRFQVERIETLTGQISFRWLFGLIRFRIKIPGVAETGKKEPKPKVEHRKERKATKKQSGRSNVMAVIKQAAFRKRLYRFFKDLVRAAHSRDLYLRLRLGLGDPAATGLLWAFLGPTHALLQNLRSAEITFEPEFVDPVFEFESHGQFRLVPLQFIAIAISFVLSPPSLRAWRTMRQSHA